MQAHYSLKEVEKDHWVACERIISGDLSWQKTKPTESTEMSSDKEGA